MYMITSCKVIRLKDAERGGQEVHICADSLDIPLITLPSHRNMETRPGTLGTPWGRQTGDQHTAATGTTHCTRHVHRHQSVHCQCTLAQHNQCTVSAHLHNTVSAHLHNTTSAHSVPSRCTLA